MNEMNERTRIMFNSSYLFHHIYFSASIYLYNCDFLPSQFIPLQFRFCFLTRFETGTEVFKTHNEFMVSTWQIFYSRAEKDKFLSRT